MKSLSLLLLVALPMGAQTKQADGTLGLTIGTSTIPDPYIYCTADAKLFCNPKGMVSVKAGDSTVVKLSDEEYANLQKLRQAVVDEEKRLAVKYGANLYLFHLSDPCKTLAAGQPCDSGGMMMDERPVDHYEFHGQFLLIDKPQWSSGISDGLVKDLPRNCDGCNPIILNRWPDGSVLKGAAK